MPRTERKNPRLQEKLDAIQREISRVESEIQGISRAVETPDSIEVLRRLKQVQGGSPAGGVESPRPLPRETGPVRAIPVITDEAGILPIPKPQADPKFNTYFGTGSLHSVRPLRQERNVQRNRAIFMSVVAILVIMLVLKLIF